MPAPCVSFFTFQLFDLDLYKLEHPSMFLPAAKLCTFVFLRRRTKAIRLAMTALDRSRTRTARTERYWDRWLFGTGLGSGLLGTERRQLLDHPRTLKERAPACCRRSWLLATRTSRNRTCHRDECIFIRKTYGGFKQAHPTDHPRPNLQRFTIQSASQ